MNPQKFQELVKTGKTVLILASQTPDMDCLGSGLILKKYLEFLGKSVTLMVPRVFKTGEKDLFSVLPYINEVKNGDTREVLSKKNFDLLIFVDGPNLVQFYDEDAKGARPDITVYDRRMRIDHHLETGEPLGTINIVRTDVSSATELVLVDLIPDDFIDDKIANLGYAAIIGDTGNFRWNFYPSTLKLAGKLLEKGANPLPIIDKMLFSKTKRYFEMLAFGISNMEYFDDLGTSMLSLPFEKLQKEGLRGEKLDDLAHAFYGDLARAIPEYPRAFFLSEVEKGVVGVHARGSNSNNKINLPKVLSELGPDGGGHFNACGINLKGDFEEIKEKLLKTLQKYLKDI